MLTSVEFEAPVTSKLISKLTDDAAVIKQLIANVERNRVKWRKDLDGDSISIQRRLALQSIKDKLDNQACALLKEQQESDEKLQSAKRRE